MTALPSSGPKLELPGSTSAPGPQQIKSFEDFWPFYLREHSNRTNRRWHFIGTLTVHVVFACILVSWSWKWLWTLPLIGYGLAWGGHFIFEKNRPATFKYPLWSLRADFKMFYQILLGKMKF